MNTLTQQQANDYLVEYLTERGTILTDSELRDFGIGASGATAAEIEEWANDYLSEIASERAGDRQYRRDLNEELEAFNRELYS